MHWLPVALPFVYVISNSLVEYFLRQVGSKVLAVFDATEMEDYTHQTSPSCLATLGNKMYFAGKSTSLHTPSYDINMAKFP